MKKRILLIAAVCVPAFVLGVIVGRMSLAHTLAQAEDLVKRMITWHEKIDERVVWDHRGEADACPVHDTALVLDVLPVVSHSQEIHDPELDDARVKHFPYANSEYRMRAIFGWTMEDALVLYCPACRQAETEWKKGRADQNKLERQDSNPQAAGR